MEQNTVLTMTKPKYEDSDRINCPDCYGKLINVIVDEQEKLQCNVCRNYYVPIATTPFERLGQGWTDDDWEDLYNR